MHILKIRKNLVSGYLLNKVGFTQTIGVDMFILKKNGIFVGKSYAIDGMFELNIDANKLNVYAYMISFFNVSF